MMALYNSLVYFVWFMATFYMIYFVLSLISFKDKLFENKRYRKEKNPFVSIIIPAFNEEKSIAESIESLKKITYRNIEFLVMNDGSKDSTSKIVRKYIKGDKRFRFFDNKENKGKATVLNQGTKEARGEFVACMDADSLVQKNIVEKILPYFSDNDVGAVTVTVEVNKPKGLMHKIVALEFALGLSLFLKIFSFLDCVFVTPGPFSMYRKEILNKIGGFNPKNITEDHEIAFRIHKNGYEIKNCIEAKVYTNLPESFKGIYIQRRRWYSGAIQTFFQHRDMLARPRYGFFSYFVPFNFFLIGLGLTLFTATTLLWITKNIRELLFYRHTGFNFFENFSLSIDFLYIGQVNIFGISLFLSTIMLMIIGVKITKRKLKDNRVGALGYPFMFFLYQIFWGGALLAVLKGKKIKWR